MKIKVRQTPLKDLTVIEIDYFQDHRGFFIEPWHQKDFAEAGLDLKFVQEGHSGSQQGVIRGLHYQDQTAPMAKLVTCLRGQAFQVAVDIRFSSPTFGQWHSLVLDEEKKNQLYVPAGFALGMAALSDRVELYYHQTSFYTPSAGKTIAWNDPDIGIKWPIKKPILSEKDQKGKSWQEYLKNPDFK